MRINLHEIVIDCLDPVALAPFWAALLGRPWGSPWEGWAVVDSTPLLAFQQVPEAKQVKNRLHLDLEVDDLQTAVDRAVGFGATLVRPIERNGDSGYVVLADPAGNEFCFITDPTGSWAASLQDSAQHSPADLRRVAGVVVIDASGRLLLQERDEHAPVNPNVWGLCGGLVEPGESYDEAAVRELEEETGLTGLELTHVLTNPPELTEPPAWQLYLAFSETLTDADIVLGEGRQIVFVDPADLDGLDIADFARPIISQVLTHPLYRAWLARPGRPTSSQ